MKFGNRDKIIFSAFALLIVFFWFQKNTLPIFFLVVFMIIGLIIAIMASEKAVEGVDVFGKKLGLTPGKKVLIREKDGALIIKPFVPPSKFITELKGCISIKDHKIDPLKLKEIWGVKF